MPQITQRRLRNAKKRLAFGLIYLVITIAGSALTVSSTSARSQEKDKRLSFTLPSAPWSLTLPAKDFVMRQKQLKPDGSGAYFYLTDEQSGLNVSFYIEPTADCKDSRSCRDMVRDAGNPAWESPQNLKSSQLGDISYFEFFVPSVQGRPIKQQNMYAEFVVDGYWVDLHISKVLYEPRDHQLFEDLVKSIKFQRK